jgi:hypothetical protein
VLVLRYIYFIAIALHGARYYIVLIAFIVFSIDSRSPHCRSQIADRPTHARTYSTFSTIQYSWTGTGIMLNTHVHAAARYILDTHLT